MASLVILTASCQRTATSPARHLLSLSLTCCDRDILLDLGAVAGRMTRGKISNITHKFSFSMFVANLFQSEACSLVYSPLEALGGHLWVGMAVACTSGKLGKGGPT